MTFQELRRTTTFRLTAVYGTVFAAGVVLLLGAVYLQSSVYLTQRVDRILATQAEALSRSDPEALIPRIGETLAINGDQTVLVGLFSASREWVAGNLKAYPPTLTARAPLEIAPTATFHTPARVIARDLPDGERLVVGRDIGQVRELRAIILSTLLASGVLILAACVGSAVALSIGPLRRVRLLQAAAHQIAAGDLQQRMPLSQRHDELDMFAATVNGMIGEVERLMSEVKAATETIAHDLRTPLTRARAQLRRLEGRPRLAEGDVEGVAGEIDAVLDRFAAILRISELEARERRAGFLALDLGEIVRQAGDLYQPLAEAQGVRLTTATEPAAPVEADPKLLFEAVSNLLDNAVKFTGEGGSVRLSLQAGPGAAPRIVVEDDGPGIAPDERTAVLQRFYRGERDRAIPGSGLGLSIVAAIVRLHRFGLALEDAGPGLRAVIDCRAAPLSY